MPATSDNSRPESADTYPMPDPTGDYLDIISAPDGEYAPERFVPAPPSGLVAGVVPAQESAAAASRPWIGIHFACCGHYIRVYRRPNETRYVAKCPNCHRRAVLKVAANGTSARIFRAGPN
ncbi:MAG: hypothetical protein HBSAPP02_10140 [Phycisphaerae bacterium]|nr:MAG: hypothetical protein HBSAPP02_10140 [Phycisphaerae bacterium]